MLKAIGTGGDAVLTGISGVESPYVVVVPYSKRALAVIPFGLTEPFKVAELWETFVGAAVVTIGARGPRVVKLHTVE